MLFAAIVFIVAAVVSALFGYAGIATEVAETGVVLFVVFAVICSLLAGIGAVAMKLQEQRRRQSPV
jgi:uncharacterized membrane protein YtjA (UPF0391 family)